MLVLLIQDGRMCGSGKYRFTAEPGQKVALLAPAVPGKTTCFSCCCVSIRCRLVRLPQWRGCQSSWAGRVAQLYWVVPQEPALFSVTIAENIAFGRPDASREEIKAAASRLPHMILYNALMAAMMPGR